MLNQTIHKNITHEKEKIFTSKPNNEEVNKINAIEEHTEIEKKEKTNDFADQSAKNPKEDNFKSSNNNSREDTESPKRINHKQVDNPQEHKPVKENIPKPPESVEVKTTEVKSQLSSSDVNTKETANNFRINEAIDKTQISNEFVDSKRTQTEKSVQLADLVKEVSKYVQKQEKNSITLILDPKELGKVKLNLDLIDKIIHARFEVENEAVRKVLESQMSQLSNNLQNMGLQVGSYSVALSNNENKGMKASDEDKRKAVKRENKEINNDEIMVEENRSKSLGYNTYDYLV